MEKFHVVVAYDLTSNKDGSNAWSNFKQKYFQYLVIINRKREYPETTAVFSVDAETYEKARGIVKKNIDKWLEEIKAENEDEIISMPKCLIARCDNEELTKF